MHECHHGGEHEPMEGVLYRRCNKCGNLYAIRDEQYLKERGESSVDNFYDESDEVV